jgi:hypothetical protein
LIAPNTNPSGPSLEGPHKLLKEVNMRKLFALSILTLFLVMGCGSGSTSNSSTIPVPDDTWKINALKQGQAVVNAITTVAETENIIHTLSNLYVLMDTPDGSYPCNSGSYSVYTQQNVKNVTFSDCLTVNGEKIRGALQLDTNTMKMTFTPWLEYYLSSDQKITSSGGDMTAVETQGYNFVLNGDYWSSGSKYTFQNAAFSETYHEGTIQQLMVNGRIGTYTFQDLTFSFNPPDSFRSPDTFTMAGSMYVDGIGATSVQTVTTLVWDAQLKKVTSGHVVANQLVHVEWSNATPTIWYDRNQNGLNDQDEVVQ